MFRKIPANKVVCDKAALVLSKVILLSIRVFLVIC